MTPNSTIEQPSPGSNYAPPADSDSARYGDTAAAATERLADAAAQLKTEATAFLARLQPRVDAATAYVKAQPMKTLLIAAACGAAVVGVVAIANRPGARRMFSAAELRRAAQGAADHATRIAHDTIERASSLAGSASKSSREAAEKTTSSAQSIADSALDSLAETVQEWRDQAAPLVARFQPQIDAVTSYAKQEPGKSAFAVAAAGAAIAGLLALLNRDSDDETY